MGSLCFFSNVRRSKVSAPILLNNSFVTKDRGDRDSNDNGKWTVFRRWGRHHLCFETEQRYCDIESPTKQREKRLQKPCCVISSNDRYGKPNAEIANDGYSTYFQQQKGLEQVEDYHSLPLGRPNHCCICWTAFRWYKLPGHAKSCSISA